MVMVHAAVTSASESHRQRTNRKQKKRWSGSFPSFGKSGSQSKNDEEEVRGRDDRIRTQWQIEVWDFFDKPESSKAATRFGNIMMILICISLVTLVLEPDPSMRSVPKAFWVYLDMIIVLAFTTELAARFYLCPSRFKFWWPISMNWADLLSILPFFLDLAMNQGIEVPPDDPKEEVDAAGGGSLMRGLRTIRLFRVLRIMKVSRYNTEFDTFIRTLSKSSGAVRILILLMMLQILIYSVLVYDIEHTKNGEQFQSIPQAMWWAVVTSCTVGYGDMSPKTTFGKVLGSISMLTGMVVMSLPLSIIGANCVREYLSLQELKMENYQKELDRQKVLLAEEEERQKSLAKDHSLDTPKERLDRFRRHAYDATGGDGRAGKVVLTIVCAAIFSSIVSIVLRSMPELENHVKDSTWSAIELVCVLIFTVEFMVRLCCCPNLKEFFMDPFTWIDFIATFPFYIQQGLGGDVDFAVARVFRVVRLLKLFRHDAGIGVLLETLGQSGSAVLMLCGVVGANLLFFSVAVFEFERGDWDECCTTSTYDTGRDMCCNTSTYQATGGGTCAPIDAGEGCYVSQHSGVKSKFQSVVAGFYWTIETITTVGYGDINPLSTPGQIVGGVCCVIGVLSITLPITIIGVNFCAAYDKHAMRENSAHDPVAETDDSEESDGKLAQLREKLEERKRFLKKKYGNILSESDKVGFNIVLKDEVHELLERLPPKEGMQNLIAEQRKKKVSVESTDNLKLTDVEIGADGSQDQTVAEEAGGVSL